MFRDEQARCELPDLIAGQDDVPDQQPDGSCRRQYERWREMDDQGAAADGGADGRYDFVEGQGLRTSGVGLDGIVPRSELECQIRDVVDVDRLDAISTVTGNAED